MLFNAFFKKITVFNTSNLSSGRVRRTRCQISEGALAPVASILTRPLCISIYVIDLNSAELKWLLSLDLAQILPSLSNLHQNEKETFQALKTLK